MRATQAIIHLENLVSNINVVRKHIGPAPRICFPVKADAYGHGAVEVAKCALSSGVSYLAVATTDEGVELRAAGITAPVLLLSEAIPAELDTVAANKLTPFISDAEYAKRFADAVEKAGGGPAPVFLKIDSGMGRLGCAAGDAVEVAKSIVSQKSLTLAGCATHFAVSDESDADNKAYTKQQIERFTGCVAGIRGAGIDPGIVTMANTGATVSWPECHFDMVRPGILLYGYQDASIKPALGMKPLMELVTQVVHIKKMRKGESVSYGRIWTAPEDTYIGVLPIGYADGFPRLLSGKNYQVWINGKGYPQVGRICMDQCMINLGTECAVKRYDKVVLAGGESPKSAADIAKLIGTISYEVTCNINKRVPRIYSR